MEAFKLQLTIPTSPNFKTNARKRICDIEIPKKIVDRAKSVAVLKEKSKFFSN
jgi:hypothetical protein